MKIQACGAWFVLSVGSVGNLVAVEPWKWKREARAQVVEGLIAAWSKQKIQKMINLINNFRPRLGSRYECTAG